MTNTPTTDLAAALGAKKAELNGQPAVPDEVIPPADQHAGEIVGAAPSQEGREGQAESPLLPVPSTGGGAAPAETESLGTRSDATAPIPYPTIAPKVIGGLPYASQYARLAKTIANTEMVPGAMRGRYDAVTAAFMRGYEMGLGPMQALDSFHVIDGKVGLTAEAMRALIIQDGHQILLEDIYGEDGTTFMGTKAECHRKDWPDDQWRTYVWSIEDARKAGLLRPSRSGKPSSWETYPRAMCDARATSGAGRRYFPDVLAGMSYTPEEIRDFDGPAEQEAPPSPTSNQSPAPPAPPETSETETTGGDAGAMSAPAPSAPEDPTQSSSASSQSSPPAAKKAAKATKKAPAAPKVAPSASESTESMTPPAPDDASTPPAPTPPIAQSTPDSSSASPSEDLRGGVTAAMITGLTEVIKGLPAAQQPLCRAFINQHFPNRAINTLTQNEVQKCIDIAAGFPDSIEQHPLPNNGQHQLL